MLHLFVTQETFDNVKGIAQPGCHLLIGFFHVFFNSIHHDRVLARAVKIIDNPRRQKIAGFGHLTKSHPSSCQLLEARISVRFKVIALVNVG